MRISDWSSDVCSSDLLERSPPPAEDQRSIKASMAGWEAVTRSLEGSGPIAGRLRPGRGCRSTAAINYTWHFSDLVKLRGPRARKIGRASCRERVCQYV